MRHPVRAALVSILCACAFCAQAEQGPPSWRAGLAAVMPGSDGMICDDLTERRAAGERLSVTDARALIDCVATASPYATPARDSRLSGGFFEGYQASRRPGAVLGTDPDALFPLYLDGFLTEGTDS